MNHPYANLPIRQIKKAFRKIRYTLAPSRYTPKVFCIGYNKTGTTTLGRALQTLGYKHSSFNRDIYNHYKLKQFEKIVAYTAKFDSFDDLPWLKEDMIPLLDQNFPNSKFIYLTRDEKSWKRSFYNWRYKVFGVHPDVEIAWQEYTTHEKFIQSHFKNRPETDFLTLEIQDPKGFSKLAEFLGKHAPRDDFPVWNQSQ